METVSFFLILGIGLLLAAWLFHLNLSRAEQKRTVAWLTLGLGLVLGPLAAKLVYVLFRADEVFSLYGPGALIRLNPEEFSFMGGCAGFVSACILAALLRGVRVHRALDLMAGPLALGVAFARAAESFLGLMGQGEDLTDAAWTHFFPLAMEYEYPDEWYLAVNLQLALLAVVTVLLAVHWLRSCEAAPGVCFGRTLVALCAPLFILELMRAVSVTILVRVHTEQILCFAVMAACIMTAAVRVRRSAWGIWGPVLLLVLILGLNVALPFGADGKMNPFLEGLPFPEDTVNWLVWHRWDWCYPAMILTDIGLICMEMRLTRRRLRMAAAEQGGKSE